MHAFARSAWEKLRYFSLKSTNFIFFNFSVQTAFGSNKSRDYNTNMLISGTSNSIIFQMKSMKQDNEIKFPEILFKIER